MDINEAKKIYEKYNYDSREMSENNAYSELKKYNVSKEIVEQWYQEEYSKRIMDFKQNFSVEKDNSELVWQIYRGFCKYIDDKGIVVILNQIFSNVATIQPNVEINYYMPVLCIIAYDNFTPLLSDRIKKQAIELIRKRLELIFEKYIDLQQKYQHLYNLCDNKLNNMKL